MNAGIARIAATGMAAALLAALSGCSAMPLFARPPEKATLSDAPRVLNPRDLRGIPVCNLLTPTQVEGFGLDSASARSRTQKIDDTQSVDRCLYRSSDLRSQAAIDSAYRFGIGGLDRLYLNREGAPVFVPETLDGFPLVRTDAEDNISCDLNIGVADNQLLIVSASTLSGAAGTSACDTARALASAVLANLPPLR